MVLLIPKGKKIYPIAFWAGPGQVILPVATIEVGFEN